MRRTWRMGWGERFGIGCVVVAFLANVAFWGLIVWALIKFIAS